MTPNICVLVFAHVCLVLQILAHVRGHVWKFHSDCGTLDSLLEIRLLHPQVQVCKGVSQYLLLIFLLTNIRLLMMFSSVGSSS